MAMARSMAAGAIFPFRSIGFTSPFLGRLREFCASTQRVESSAEGIRGKPLQQGKWNDRPSSSDYGRQSRSWMPDPVTGCFIPEDQFGQIDVADLRERVLRDRSVFRGQIKN